MKVMVMGAGYVGMRLLRSLQEENHEIFITTTDAKRVEELKKHGTVLVLNTTREEVLREGIDCCDALIILVAPKNSETYEETYLQTAKQISFAIENRTRPLYILYTSSTSVCEGLQGEWITEEKLLTPKSENARTLLATEEQFLHANADVCVLRLGGIYGPGRDLEQRTKRFSGKKMKGTGKEATNHIHLEDIVSAIIFCLSHSLKGIYHLVNDDHTTREELYSRFCGALGIPCPVWDPENSESRGKGYIVSNRKIKEAGFVFQHRFCRSVDPCPQV